MVQRIRTPHDRPQRKLAGQTSGSFLLKVGLLVVAMFLIWWLAFSSPETTPEGALSAAGSVAPEPKKPSPVAPARVREEPKPAAAVEPAVPNAEPPPTAKAAALAENTQAPTASLPQRQGPVEELSKRFAGESRGPDSEKEEARVRAAFVDPTIPPSLLHSVECRRSVCRAQLQWRAEHDMGYVLGLTRAVGTYSAPVGIEGAGAAEPDGHRPLVVYFGLSK